MANKARRDYGTGSIFQKHEARYGCPDLVEGPAHPTTGKPTKVRPEHKCKGRWVGTVDHGWTPNQGRRRPTVTGPTEAAVKVRLRKLIAQLEDGADATATRKTVKQWSEEWLKIVERTMRPQPFTNTRSAVRRWIVPTIGHKRLSDLTPADVRKVANAQRSAGLKTSSQRRTHSTLMTMLQAARADGYAVPAIVVEVKAPAANATDRSDLPVPTAVAVLNAATATPQGSRWAAALLQGLRQAEALGLTWGAVDLDRELLEISWQLQPLPYRIRYDRTSGFRVPDDYEAKQVRGRWHLVRPKTRAGWRVIPLVPWMVTALDAWRDVAPESEHDLVWPTLDGGPCDPKDDDAEWCALQQTAALDLGTAALHESGRLFTMHEARHTTATLLLEAGVEPAIIIAILGHSSMLSTKAYLHVKTAPLAEAMSKVAERLQLVAPA